MTQAQFSALRRAWHRKTRRPVPAVMVTVGEDFFTEGLSEAEQAAAVAEQIRKQL